MIYEYWFDNVYLSDLQQEKLNVIAAGVDGCVGLSSCTGMLSSVGFESELNQGQLNRLITYARTKAGNAVYLGMSTNGAPP